MKGIELYIGGMRADLDDGSLILMNYTFEDLQSPAAVKNSYSKQLTLKGTDGNNRIFGGIFRPDRTSSSEAGGAGAAFNPSARAPFTIYAPTGEILQSGYAKLDSVTRNGSDISYGVTLYGGLGSFLYSLMYDEDGDKLTLADLDYLGTSDPASELDFTISKAAVQEAWTALRSGNPSGKWKVVNFAACYNGVPDSDFSADKAVVIPSDIGLPSLIIDADDGFKSYTPDGNWVAISLSQEHDEWAMKDLRSYLQRPVLSVHAFIDAVCNPSNNGGYEVDISDIDDYKMRELDAWMTLPMLTELPVSGVQTPSFEFVTDDYTNGRYVGLYNLTNGPLPSGTNCTMNVDIFAIFGFSQGAALLVLSAYPYYSVLFFQLVAYHGTNPNSRTAVAKSKIKAVTGDGIKLSPESLAEALGINKRDNEYEESYTLARLLESPAGSGEYYIATTNGDLKPMPLAFSIESSAFDSIEIQCTCYFFTYNNSTNAVSQIVNSGVLPHAFLRVGGTDIVATSSTSEENAPISASVENVQSTRSYSAIDKDILLGTLGTPADYLLSFCKLFGLVMTCDDVDRKITIMRRKSFFQDTVTDLSGRVDLSQQLSITPLTFAAKWYDLELEGSGGAYEEDYLQRYGRAYGMQRINTGYRFDSDNVEVLSGLAFKAAATVLEYGPYWNIITDYGKVVPSVFIDNGNTYTLYDAEGNSKDFDVPRPSLGSTVEYLNGTYKGYDMQNAAKLQLHDVDGKPCDGSGVLVYLSRSVHYDNFKLSDDNGAMAALNDNTPCWDLTPGDGLDVPIFSTYTYRYVGGDMVLASLDIGVPAEIGIPGVDYPQQATTIYARYWKDYIADRYSVDNKVMKCKVDMRDMRVSQELMRGFWWYADSLWLLNAITDHSLTTDDYTECELIQVREKESYME